ncbi:MAG: LysR substrate-binding domain-containing protein [Pseudomonadota bacterium]
MTLQELRYIVALADTGHFAKAAERCHVSQPTLSTQLKKLEDYLGVTLFDRSLRQVSATPAGREIVERARLVLAEVERIKAIAKQSLDPMARTLNLGVIPTAGPYFLPHAVRVVHRAYPQLRLLLREDFTANLLNALAQGRVDAALLALPVPGEGLQAAPLFQEPFVAALPKGHALAKKKIIDTHELAREKILLLEEGHCFREQALEVCGLRGDFGEEVKATSLETLRQMVAIGIGCTLLPALAAKGRNAGIELRSLKQPVPSRTMGLVWRSRSPHQETLQRLAETWRANLPEGVTAV